jgi:hypothetical protein
MPPDSTIPFPNPNARGQRITAASLFLDGRVVEASTMLSSAILHGESVDLWNDWGIVPTWRLRTRLAPCRLTGAHAP